MRRLAGDVVDRYVANVRMVEALGQWLRFPSIFLLAADDL